MNGTAIADTGAGVRGAERDLHRRHLGERDRHDQQIGAHCTERRHDGHPDGPRTAAYLAPEEQRQARAHEQQAQAEAAVEERAGAHVRAERMYRLG
jgi:hypothetical protein